MMDEKEFTAKSQALHARLIKVVTTDESRSASVLAKALANFQESILNVLNTKNPPDEFRQDVAESLVFSATAFANGSYSRSDEDATFKHYENKAQSTGESN